MTSFIKTMIDRIPPPTASDVMLDILSGYGPLGLSVQGLRKRGLVMDISESNVRVALNRLANQRKIASPRRGHYAINFSGYALHDDGSASDAWVFPDDTVIDAGGFLIVWADDVDEDGLGDTQGEISSALHASFKLSKDGEALVLLDASGEIADSVEFPALGEEESYARIEDGGADWAVFTAATPGASNN